MKYPEKYKKYIRELLEYIRREIFHGEYHMVIDYMEEDKAGKTNAPGHGSCTAEIFINPTYLSFKLEIYPIVYEFYKDKDGHAIAEVLVHELCHLLTEPLYELACKSIDECRRNTLEEIRERQTQRITNIIMLYLSEKAYKL